MDVQFALLDDARQVGWIDEAIEQVAFWGIGGTTHSGEPGRSAPADSILRELTFYETILNGLPGYGERQQRRKRAELQENIRTVVGRLRRAKSEPEAHACPRLELPTDHDSSPGPATPVAAQTLDDLEDRLLCCRFDVTNARVETADGPRDTGPMKMLWFGTWDVVWSQPLSAAELRSIKWPRPLGYQCACMADGLPVCILGDLLWRGVELARRYGPKLNQRQALEAAIAAHTEVYSPDESRGG